MKQILNYYPCQVFFHKITQNTKYIILNYNYFDINLFTPLNNDIQNSRLSQIEYLELNSVYLKRFMKIMNQVSNKFTGLKYLVIRDSEINLQEIKSLQDIIKASENSLEEIRLINTYIDEKEAKSLFKLLKNLKKLNLIDLSGNYISCTFVSEIIEYSQINPNLFRLELNDCGITKESFEKLIESLNKNFVLHFNSLSFSTIPRICSKEFQEKQIIKLDLNPSFTYFPTDKLSLTNSNNCHILEMNFNMVNLIKTRNILLDAFTKIRYCKTLRLKKCYNKNSVFYYFKTILQNTTIDYLDLRYTLINKDNINDLVDLLSNQSKLKGVNISFTQLEDPQFIILLNYITQNQRQFQLEMNKNKLSKDSLIKIDFYKKIFPWMEKTFFYKNTFVADYEDNNNCKSYTFLLDNEKDAIKEYEIAKKILSNQEQRNIEINKFNKFDFTISKKNIFTKFQKVKNNPSFITKVFNINLKILLEKCIIWDSENIVCLFKANEDYNNDNQIYKISIINLITKSLTEIVDVEIEKIERINVFEKMNDDTLVYSSGESLVFWSYKLKQCIKILENISTECLLIFDSNTFITFDEKNIIQIWDTNTYEYKEIQDSNTNRWGCLAKFSNNSFFTGSNSDGEISIWNINDMTCKQKFYLEQGEFGLLTKFNERNMIYTYSQKSLSIRDFKSNISRQSINAHTGGITNLIKFNDKIFISGSESDRFIKVWDFFTLNCLVTLSSNNFMILNLTKINDSMFASTSFLPFTSTDGFESEIIFWKINNKSETQLISDVNNILPFNKNELLFIQKEDEIKVYEIATRKSLCNLKIQKSLRYNCFIHLNGICLYDKKISLYEYSTDEKVMKEKVVFNEGHDNCKILSGISYSDDILITGSEREKDKKASIKYWSISQIKCIRKIEQPGSIKNLILLDSSNFVGICYKEIKIFDFNSEILTFNEKNAELSILAKFNETSLISSSIRDIKLWSVGNNEPIAVLKGESRSGIETFAVLSDRLFSSGHSNYKIRIWDYYNRICIKCFEEINVGLIKKILPLENNFIITFFGNSGGLKLKSLNLDDSFTINDKSYRNIIKISSKMIVAYNRDAIEFIDLGDFIKFN